MVSITKTRLCIFLHYVHVCLFVCAVGAAYYSSVALLSAAVYDFKATSLKHFSWKLRLYLHLQKMSSFDVACD